MTEVLYDPINNELYLFNVFNGMFEVDTKGYTVAIYVAGSKKLGMALKSDCNFLKVEAESLVHIGWL